jgi:hypothetical protein
MPAAAHNAFLIPENPLQDAIFKRNKPMVYARADIETPPAKTKPEVDADVLASIDPAWLDDAFVYVHCHVPGHWGDMLIRIWRTTYLADQQSEAKANLLHAVNITYAPLWTQVPPRGRYSFVLIFSALPKSCLVFDLIEDIPQPGGFHIKNIARNSSDVYHITLA